MIEKLGRLVAIPVESIVESDGELLGVAIVSSIREVREYAREHELTVDWQTALVNVERSLFEEEPQLVARVSVRAHKPDPDGPRPL
jgi:hypothetical protein